MIFCHYGDYGDTVYALMAVRDLCEEAGEQADFHLYPVNGTRALMTEEHAHNLLPLIRGQQYIRAASWRPSPRGVRVDQGIRRFWQRGLNIADQHAHYLGTPYSGGRGPWLTVPSRSTVAPVVFARSARYRNPAFPWRQVYERFGGDACFVGTADEHAEFEARIGAVPHTPTETLLDVARVVAGCRLFVGNASCPRAIAEGLKVPVCAEHGRNGNCHFERPDAWYDRLPPARFGVAP